jgi:hypothetical protein
MTNGGFFNTQSSIRTAVAQQPNFAEDTAKAERTIIFSIKEPGL